MEKRIFDLNIADLESIIQNVVNNSLQNKVSNKEEADDILTVDAVCELLGVKRPTLDKYKLMGLKHSKIAGRVLFLRSDVFSFVSNYSVN